jgi:hypothetical protein
VKIIKTYSCIPGNRTVPLDSAQGADCRRSGAEANPRFMKLLENAKVREIQKRVGELS